MAYTQWESRNIDKKKNIIEFRGTGDKPTGNYIGENSTLLDYESGNKFYWKDGTWKPLKESSSSGSSGGEGLPADFPAEGSENANKFIGFDANGDYTAKDAPAGGGAEKFVVTLTQENDTWTADKTIAEIIAADAANKVVVAKYPVGAGVNIEIQLSSVDETQDVTAAIFIGIDVFSENKSVVSVECINQSGEDAIQVDKTPIPTSTNAPLIVTLTAGATEGQFVGDKTYKEVYDSFISAKTCLFNMKNSDGLILESFSLGNASFSGEYYSIASGDVSATGAANDYIMFNFT